MGRLQLAGYQPNLFGRRVTALSTMASAGLSSASMREERHDSPLVTASPWRLLMLKAPVTWGFEVRDSSMR